MTTPKTKLAGIALIAALCAGFTLGLTAPAGAGFDEAVAALQRGDYATAFRELRPLAERGNGEAQYNLGIMYRNGRGVPQDNAKAVGWFRKAAEQGVALAQYFLGVMYDNGEGVSQNYATAVKWYRKAAEQGYAGAQFDLGVMYNNGEGVLQDYAEAARWYRKAVEQGYGRALINLGFMYSKGQGVPQDYVQAHMWYNLAASRFPPGENHDQSVKNRDLVAEKMTPAQIAEAQRMAREWLERRRTGGHQ